MLDAMRDELKKFCESGDCRNCILSTQCDELEEKCGYDLSTCEKYPNEWIPPIYHYYKLRNMCTGRPCNDQCPAFRTGCDMDNWSPDRLAEIYEVAIEMDVIKPLFDNTFSAFDIPESLDFDFLFK